MSDLDVKKLRELAKAAREPFEPKPELDAIYQWYKQVKIEEGFREAVSPTAVLALLDEIELLQTYGTENEALRRIVKRVTAQLEDAKAVLKEIGKGVWHLGKHWDVAMSETKARALDCLKRLDQK